MVYSAPFAAIAVNSSSAQNISSVLHIGGQAVEASDLVPLLRAYGMLPALIKELVLDQAIATVTLTPAAAAAAASAPSTSPSVLACMSFK